MRLCPRRNHQGKIGPKGNRQNSEGGGETCQPRREKERVARTKTERQRSQLPREQFPLGTGGSQNKSDVQPCGG